VLEDRAVAVSDFGADMPANEGDAANSKIEVNDATDSEEPVKRTASVAYAKAAPPGFDTDRGFFAHFAEAKFRRSTNANHFVRDVLQS